jgi:hypothetical protein
MKPPFGKPVDRTVTRSGGTTQVAKPTGFATARKFPTTTRVWAQRKVLNCGGPSKAV